MAPLIGLRFSQMDYPNGLCRSMFSHSSRTCGCRCRRAETDDRTAQRLGAWIFFGFENTALMRTQSGRIGPRRFFGLPGRDRTRIGLRKFFGISLTAPGTE